MNPCTLLDWIQISNFKYMEIQFDFREMQFKIPENQFNSLSISKPLEPFESFLWFDFPKKSWTLKSLPDRICLSVFWSFGHLSWEIQLRRPWSKLTDFGQNWPISVKKDFGLLCVECPLVFSGTVLTYIFLLQSKRGEK